MKKFITIFAFSLFVIPGVQADFMTYFLNYAHSPDRSSFLRQTKDAEKETSLSELAMNPLISLPGTQDEFENPFNKLFEQQTEELIKNKDDNNNNILNFALWKLLNPSIYDEYSGEDELEDYLFKIENPTIELLESDVEDAQKQNTDFVLENHEETVINLDPISENHAAIDNSEGYWENEYLNRAALNYFIGDSFIESLYGPLSVQSFIPSDYIYEISQKYSPAMLKLQLPISIELGTLKLAEGESAKISNFDLAASDQQTTDEPTLIDPEPYFPEELDSQKIINETEPQIPQPYNSFLSDMQSAKDEIINHTIAENLPEIIAGIDVNTTY